MKTENNLDSMRHSAAHLLAAGVLELYPNVKLTIGPAIESGFYYDFDFENSPSEEDFPKIEKKMHEVLKGWSEFSHREVSETEAKEFYKDNNYKKELIDEIVEKGEKITFYKVGNFEDLCRGGHAENPSKEIGAFKLLSIAGAYWRGDEKNKMLTRIYGTAFPTQKELDDHITLLEEAKKRDHKKLGKELGLFVFSDAVGKGLPLLTPKGSVIRRELERFIVDEELRRDYLHVYTPDIANLDLYKKSGHYPYYKDSMYSPIKIEDEEYMLRPMTCPHHFELYLSEPHSYKELPMRYAELAHLYRFEQSGELTGLQRVRTFTLADAHIIAMKSQAEMVINEVLDLIEYVAKAFQLEAGADYHYRLSLGNRADDKKYFKDDASWDYAENTLRSVLTARQAHFVEASDEAAFYGPKVDVQMKNVNGKEDTAFTVQYDFVMPGRFKLKYINEAGAEEEPIVIHRSSIGALERVMAFLIEKYAGAFPTWLSPVQAVIIPISDKQLEYAQKLYKTLKEQNIRVELDDKKEPVGAKIRRATLQKVPYLCIIGEKEKQQAAESGVDVVSLRLRDGTDQGVISISDLSQRIQTDIEKRI